MTKEQADRLVEKLGNAIDKLVEGSLRGGFDFEFRGGGDGFKFRFRVQPDDRVPVPDERSSSSFEPPIVPLQTT
jgi:hypothetical protein